MKQGVLFFNHGTRCLPRLCVAIFSLRRFYQGAISIAYEGDVPAWFQKFAEATKVGFVSAPKSDEYGLIKKSRVWRVSPFDNTLFLDADTLVRAPVDPLFAAIEQHGLMVTRFNDWHTHRGRMRRRIEQWRQLFPALVDGAVKYGKAINTGIFGWKRGIPAMPDYEQMTAKGLTKGISRKTLDELAMQLILPRHRHVCVGSEWNSGCVHMDGEKANIVHYHGHKHCRDEKNAALWKAEFWELVKKHPEIKKKLTTDPEDKSVSLWIKRDFGRRKDVTIVTAVNPLYADRLKRSLDLWLNTPGLKDQQFLVFVNGFRNATDRTFLEHPNIRVVRWNYQGKSPRETMLAAFILGVSEHVKTDYWMKLDGDTVPVKPFWRWPKYEGKAYVSHRWGYTKMKGDPEAKEHWFHRLDRVFCPNAPLFKRQLDVKRDFRVGHRRGNPDGIPMRCASFAHIEQTAFTRKVAGLVIAHGGKLPAPSHDTTVWHAATAWGLPTVLMNMKEWFQP